MLAARSGLCRAPMPVPIKSSVLHRQLVVSVPHGAPTASSTLKQQRMLVRASNDGMEGIYDIMAKYTKPQAGRPVPAASSSPAAPAPSAPAAALASSTGNGVFLLLLINVVVFVLDHVLHLPFLKSLYLYHSHPAWWQFITHSFCHGSWEHLSMNLFNLCVFGKLVEETEGGFGVWFIYIVTAVGAALASYFLSPKNVVSVGASGAIFGLFAVSVMTRLKLDLRRLLEAVILGNFVVKQVLQEAKNQMAGGLMVGGMHVGHVAHLGGALAGVLLVWLLSRIPEAEPSK